MKLDLDSLERIVPTAVDQGETTGGEALGLSLERYAFASRHVRPGRLLDVACGVGYGTHLLAAGGPIGIEARGVDIVPEAIAYAREHYGGPRVAFEVHDATSFSDPRGFDSIVSIETIEHLPDPAGFVARLAGLLRPGGVIVASVPVTPSVDANPHHLHDFTERSFLRLFAAHELVHFDALRQDQAYRLRDVLRRAEPRMRAMRQHLPAWYLRHPRSLLRRLESTLRYGFVNKYLTVALQRRDAPQ